jgi:hypothetical protein
MWPGMAPKSIRAGSWLDKVISMRIIASQRARSCRPVSHPISHPKGAMP